MARQSFIGVVASAGLMQKTIKVRVARQLVHPVVGKVSLEALAVRMEFMRQTITRHKNQLVHDPDNLGAVGDRVKIEACRPMSARKRFILKEIIHKKEVVVSEGQEIR